MAASDNPFIESSMVGSQRSNSLASGIGQSILPSESTTKFILAHQGENKKENKNKIKATLRIIEVTLHVNVSDNDITYIWD